MGIDLKPGLNAELTETGVHAGYVSTWMGRFKAGLFQKIGGWSKFIALTVTGRPATAQCWQSIAGDKFLAVGTTTQLAVFNNTTSQMSDLTPQTFTSSTALDFSTSAGSNVVTVIDANISTMTPYCTVYFNTPISVDGIILSGLYGITSTLSGTSYTLTAATNAVAGVAHGGAVPRITTVAGSSNVTITFTAHNLVAGNDIVLPIATTVGGITLQGRYVVSSVTDPNNFVVVAANAAVSSAGPTSMNSGNASLLYYIATGPSKPGGAYGAGNYGAGAYSLGQTLVGQTGTPIAPTDWTLSNWGEALVSCPKNGGIFYWGPSSGFLTAQMISTAPPFNTGAFMSSSQQMIIAYGSSALSTVGVYQDPMLVKWCDASNFSQWYPTSSNQAGSFRIPTGSQVMAGAATPFCNLIWTDLDLWTMNYIGASLVFGFVKTGANCGIIGQHAFTQMAGSVYWFGRNNLFVMSGGSVSILPCAVWDIVFQDLDMTNASKCFVGSNTLHSEILFWYPSIQDGTGYPTRYVKLKVDEGSWDAGILQRNTWTDQTVFGPPVSVTNNGIIYSHETGYDADLTPMTSGFTTGYFRVGEGEEFAFIDRIVPDLKWGTFAGAKTATLQVTLNAINEMGDTPVTYGPYTITAATPFFLPRCRARQISITVQSSDSGSFWRLGHFRVKFQPDGKNH
jgi:hypothetical protein